MHRKFYREIDNSTVNPTVNQLKNNGERKKQKQPANRGWGRKKKEIGTRV